MQSDSVWEFENNKLLYIKRSSKFIKYAASDYIHVTHHATYCTKNSCKLYNIKFLRDLLLTIITSVTLTLCITRGVMKHIYIHTAQQFVQDRPTG